jgi:hypothetical protein
MPIEPDFLDYALGGYGARRDAATADAFERVGAHLLAGRPDKALAMLEYAQRLAPSDGGISLAIGLLGRLPPVWAACPDFCIWSKPAALWVGGVKCPLTR